MLDPGDRLPFVLGGPLPRRFDVRSIVAVAIVLVVVALPLRGLYLATGSSMEEGFMLVFPERLLAGDVPNVDFLHLYGPASLHVLAGWYEVVGASLASERTFGLLQHLGVIFGVYVLAAAFGRRVAMTSGVVATLLVLTPIGLSALAWEGAVALGVGSVAAGVRALHTNGAAQRRALLAAGLLAGLALGYRPDLVIALGLTHGWMLWRSRRWTPAAVGLAVGLVPLAVHFAMAGLRAPIRGMVLEPVLELRPGRALPRPPSFSRVDGALQAVVEGPADAPWWRLPALDASHQLFSWFFLVIVVAIAVPLLAHRWWRRTRQPRFSALLAGGLFGLGLLPQAMQRPDSTHLAWGTCVSFALVPCVIAEVAGAARSATLARHRATIAAAAVALLMLVVFPFYSYRSYLLHTRVSVGDRDGGFEVTRGDRRFSFGNEALQRASQAAIDQLGHESVPGERLLVGPADLSRTIYSDAIFYFLFPELTPATEFIEMDPGLADEQGSGLAEDVASADWLLLTNFWTGWFEPNASIEFGSDEPNQVVADQFCVVGDFEDALVLLYQRCAQGDGVSPALIGIGADRRADLEREIAERAAD